jgi:hypothetical protein
MSSGEADAINVTIKNPINTLGAKPTATVESSTVGSTGTWKTFHVDSDSSLYNYSPTWYYTYPYNTYIYLYQITCPKCSTMNWAQVDNVVVCQGMLGKKLCGARLKAVIDQVDYEIPVVKP